MTRKTNPKWRASHQRPPRQCARGRKRCQATARRNTWKAQARGASGSSDGTHCPSSLSGPSGCTPIHISHSSSGDSPLQTLAESYRLPFSRASITSKENPSKTHKNHNFITEKRSISPKKKQFFQVNLMWKHKKTFRVKKKLDFRALNKWKVLTNRGSNNEEKN